MAISCCRTNDNAFVSTDSRLLQAAMRERDASYQPGVSQMSGRGRGRHADVGFCRARTLVQLCGEAGGKRESACGRFGE